MPPRKTKPRVTPERAARVLDILEEAHPEARCALAYRSAFELAVATILSAQCTDERVNKVTPLLFERYPDAGTLARAPLADVEEIIRSTGFYRAKARSITGFARGLVERHGGEVPRSMAALVPLPGIGRKTANVVLGHAFDVAEGIAVDTHVLRVTNRLGLAEGDDPVDVEAQLMALVPRERWTRTTDLVIFHGRKVCDARRPACGVCPLFAECAWPSRQAWASDEPPRDRRAGRVAKPAAAARRRARPVPTPRLARRPPLPRSGRPGPGGRGPGRRGPGEVSARALAAVVQMTSTTDVERNLAAAESLVEQAAARGAAFVGLPENFAFLRSEGEPVPEPQDLDGPWVRRMAALARRTRVTLLARLSSRARPRRPARPQHLASSSGPTGRRSRSTARSTSSTSTCRAWSTSRSRGPSCPGTRS